MNPGKIVIPGGSGFLGRTFGKFFTASGHEVVVLSRQPDPSPVGRVVPWDGKSLGPWVQELDGAAAVINLAGRSVNCRYTAANRAAMMNSRVLSTRAIGEALRQCQHPPSVWLNSSTATIYKHTYGEAHGEDGETGATPEAQDAFSIEIATAWEAVFHEAAARGVRKVTLRMAMVMGAEAGGVYEVLRRLTKLGLGGRVADGRQYVSWIHAEDCCRAIEWLINKPEAEGIYNLSAPQPLTNREMMAVLRRELGVPVDLPATRWMLEVGAFLMRTQAELVIKSRRVAPVRLLSEGFNFHYPDFAGAVAALEAEIKGSSA